MHNLSPCAEWAAKLAFKPTDLSPDERAALQAHLATCPGCAATHADYQMLIARLRALPRPAARALPPLASQIVTVPDGQANGRYDSVRGAVLTLPGAEPVLPPPVPLPPARRRNWPQRLSAIAAALLVAVLVGSLALLLTNHPQPGAVTFKLRPGWTVIAEYSGVGSKTITRQHVTLPYLWGSSFTCKGDGKVDVTATGPTYVGLFGADNCSSTSANTLMPNLIFLETSNIDKIDTIKVIANADTAWYLQFAQATPQPAFKPGPEWVYGIGIGGNGDSGLIGDGPVTTANGQPLQSKVWGALFVCAGTGTGTIHLGADVGTLPIPPAETLSMSPCDGQPRLVTAHYNFATSIKSIRVEIKGDLLWTAYLIGCANEQKCGV
jgi:hypothetical protein